MNGNLVRKINFGARGYVAVLHPENRPEEKTDFLASPQQERKFNLRIKQEDLDLLDALAKRRGVTRSSLINRLLHEILLEELRSVPDSEVDLRVLIAQAADERAAYDAMQQPWILDALPGEFGDAAEPPRRARSEAARSELGRPAAKRLFRGERFANLERKMKGMPK